MAMLGQTYGFPVPVGGSGALTQALTLRLKARGGRVRCGRRVERIVVRDGRAVGVRTAAGDAVQARRAVLADVTVPALYSELLEPEHVPAQLLDDLRRFQWDFATFKVDWALDGPVPWQAEQASRAGTVHLADGMDELTRFTAQIAMRQVPDRPFLLFGQMTTADASRSRWAPNPPGPTPTCPARSPPTPPTRASQAAGTPRTRNSWPIGSNARWNASRPASAH